MRDRPDTFSCVLVTNAVDDSAGSLRALIDLAPIGLAQFDLGGRFLRVNDRLCDIFGGQNLTLPPVENLTDRRGDEPVRQILWERDLVEHARDEIFARASS